VVRRCGVWTAGSWVPGSEDAIHATSVLEDGNSLDGANAFDVTHPLNDVAARAAAEAVVPIAVQVEMH
jgi:hypothetical protein